MSPKVQQGVQRRRRVCHPRSSKEYRGGGGCVTQGPARSTEEEEGVSPKVQQGVQRRRRVCHPRSSKEYRGGGGCVTQGPARSSEEEVGVSHTYVRQLKERICTSLIYDQSAFSKTHIRPSLTLSVHSVMLTSTFIGICITNKRQRGKK